MLSRRTSCSSGMLFHCLPFAVEGIVCRTGQVGARGGVSACSDLSEDRRGGAKATEGKHCGGMAVRWSGKRSMVSSVVGDGAQ